MNHKSLSVILIAAILIFINLVSDQYFFRIDLTEDGQYTLSEATEQILAELEEPVTVTAYFSEDLPPDIAKTRSDFEDLLVEYARLSDDNIIYEFISPNEDEESEQAALQAGIQPVLVNVREKDQISQKRAFLGAVLELGEEREVIPFMQPGAALEYSLSTAIKKMAVLDKPQVALIQGHGEAPLAELAQVNDALSVLYDVEEYSLNDTLPIPSRFQTIAIVNPTDSISDAQFTHLDRFLENGGNLFIAMNRVDGDLRRASGSSVTTGLEGWLAEKGLEVQNAFAVDAECGAITVQQQKGMFRMASQVEFPYLPIISRFSEHPVTQGLEGIIFQFVSPIRYTGQDSTARFIPLATTSEFSGKRTVPLRFDIQKQWGKPDFPLEYQPVAALLEQDYENGNTSRLIIVGDGDFPINGPVEQQQQLQPDQVNLMVNAIDWLSDDTGLIDLRTKGIQYRPLEQLEDGTKSLLKYLNFLLPLLLLAAYGGIRYQRSRSLRVKRMEEDYA